MKMSKKNPTSIKYRYHNKSITVNDNSKGSVWKRFPHENSRSFCSAPLSGTIPSGFLSGIISALLSALSRMLGLFSLTACSPAWVMFLQKSTFTSSRLSPWATTPSRLQSVMRTQFSRWRQRSFLQLCSVEITSWSVMCPHPARLSDSRLGHLWDTQQWVTLLNKERANKCFNRSTSVIFTHHHAFGHIVVCMEGD